MNIYVFNNKRKKKEKQNWWKGRKRGEIGCKTTDEKSKV